MNRMGGNSEKGTATIAVVAVVCAIGIVVGAILLAANARVERARAQSAADLAVLAGANQLHNGTQDPCITARVVSNKNGYKNVSCAVVADNMKVSIDFSFAVFSRQVVSVAGPSTP